MTKFVLTLTKESLTPCSNIRLYITAGSKKDAKSCVSNLILTAVANAELSPCPHPRKIKLAPQSARKAVKSDIVKSEPMDHSTDSSSAGQDDSCAGDISQDTTVDPVSHRCRVTS